MGNTQSTRGLTQRRAGTTCINGEIGKLIENRKEAGKEEVKNLI